MKFLEKKISSSLGAGFLALSMCLAFSGNIYGQAINNALETQNSSTQENEGRRATIKVKDGSESGQDPSISSASPKLSLSRIYQRSEDIYILKGDFETIKTSGLTRVSITNPEVADSVAADSDYILMMAKAPGQTLLITWEKDGKHTRTIRVFAEDLPLVKERLTQLLSDANIKGILLEINDLEGKVVISGNINKDQSTDLNKILEPFNASIMNLVKQNEGEDLIQIDSQISELTASYTKNMGFDWTSALTYKETLPAFNANHPTDFLKVGNFSRTTQILANINALISEGKGRVLSKPKLVCVSGKEASFLVGGQIPITTTTTSSGGTVQTNVTYKDYGVTLTVNPTIRNNKVDITLNIEVSDLDSANSSGGNVAFTTRSASTQLYLENTQTVVLAGLLKTNNGETVKRIPLLSDIPVLGAIFRTRNATPNSETELIISLTPTILTEKAQESLVKATVEKGAVTPLSEQKDMIDFQERINKKNAITNISPLNQKDVAENPLASKTDHNLPPVIKEPIKEKIAPVTAPVIAVNQNQPILNEKKVVQEKVVQEKVALNAPPSAPVLSAEENSVPTQSATPKNVSVPPTVVVADASAVTPQPSVLPPSMSTEEMLNSQEVKTYMQSVQQKIAKKIKYPSKARQQNWEGTVKLSLHILNDGTLASVFIKESSGHDAIDENALQTAKDASPFVNYPAHLNLPMLSVTIPIVYSLDKK